MDKRELMRLNRRDLFKLGLTSAGAAMLAAYGIRPTPAWADGGSDFLPVSPLIGGFVGADGRVNGSVFQEELPIPKPFRTSSPGDWLTTPSVPKTTDEPAGPINKAETYPDSDEQSDKSPYQNPFISVLSTPTYYRIPIVRTTHQFTSLKVLPINSGGLPVQAPNSGAPMAGTPVALPPSPMSLFSGTFPGPMITARYGQPCVVRFENLLQGWTGSGWTDGADYGVPSSLTHLHNAHSSPESDGNPNACPEGYDSFYARTSRPYYYDNLYLNHPPDGDNRECQSFLWFHDHRLSNTSANVYSGMVGLYLLYDATDTGDETRGLGLPGVPAVDTDGTPYVKYDIPLAFFDARFDDGVTPHNGAASGGFRSGLPMEMPPQDGKTHPQSWGKPFFGHYPNHGIVGDVCTVNGVAYPVMHVKRRKYRFRFLDASLARVYQFMLMTGSVRVNPGQQGQYMLSGTQCMQMTQIATDGGLIPKPLKRDSIRLAPSKRREVIIDFTRYMDGTDTKVGDELFLTNILEMTTGRQPDGLFRPGTGIPLMKFVIDPLPSGEQDNSVIPPVLRPLPPIPADLSALVHRQFIVKRGNGGLGGWQIEDENGNGGFFDPLRPLAKPLQGGAEVWTFVNGGGGWTHPVHNHSEEHRVISRNGLPTPSDPSHIDDNSREDVIDMEPSETVAIYRQFRSFKGAYVTHCHNLAHEDNAMMFGFNIV